MAKTEMTRRIEEAILQWSPVQIGDIKINAQRKQHTALEVCAECGTTKFGIVDAVRVSEYFGDFEYHDCCRIARWRKDGYDGLKYGVECERGYDRTELPSFCDQKSCRWNFTSIAGKPKILLTCFEIKVTKSDFKSKNGHNFVGNMNFYVVPEEIFKEIEPMVPSDVGILVYMHKGKYIGLRTKRKPTYKDLTDEKQKWMILSVMKRIRDMDFENYWRKLIMREKEDVFDDGDDSGSI